jgi:dUTP pyrophosphatase
MKIKIYRIDKDNPLPRQANPGDAGYDCYAARTVFFKPGEIKPVSLGIIAQATQGYHFKLCLRSSMAGKKGFALANGVGIVDHLYAGPNDEICALLKAPESSELPISITAGDRICQLILEKNNEIEWDEQECRDFAKTDRGGLGSSGER